MAKYLDDTGVQTLWNKCKATFELKGSSGGKTYIHNIIISHSTQHAVVSFRLETTDSSAYTTTGQIAAVLLAKGCNAGSKSLHASGKVYVSSSNNGYVIGVYASSATNIGYVWTPAQTNQTITTSSAYLASGWTLVQDHVEE